MALAALASLTCLAPLAALAFRRLAGLGLAAFTGLAAIGFAAVIGGTVFQAVDGGPDVGHISRLDFPGKGPCLQVIGLFQPVHPFHPRGNGYQVGLEGGHVGFQHFCSFIHELSFQLSSLQPSEQLQLQLQLQFFL